MPDNIKCSICGSACTYIKTENSEITYHNCLNCGYIFKDSKFILDELSEKNRYLLHENDPENSGYIEYFQKFIRSAVLPFKDNIKTALDYGCGYNPVLSGLLSSYDIQSENYDKYFFPDRSFLNKKYDLVTLTEVMEHITDPLIVLTRLHSVLNNGGLLSLMTLYHPDNADSFIKWWYKNDPTHISFYTDRTMRIIASKLGMNIIFDNGKNICVLKNTVFDK